MQKNVSTDAGARLERLCAARRSDWIRVQEPSEGVQLLQAWFAGHGYDKHRHDTYGICLTDFGVQTFEYRGANEISTPGKVVVLHPDEAHDGRAGTAEGFGYRIVYVVPARIGEAAASICGGPCALPFARQAVTANAALASAIEAAFREGPAPLAIDDLVLRFTEALLELDPSCGRARALRLDRAALSRARQFLDVETTRVIRSSDLEVVTGLTRYDLARQFRAAFATSPYRYSLMRRLDGAQAQLRRGRPPGQVALSFGFADQAHFSRMFKSAFGITPARYAHAVTVCNLQVTRPRGTQQLECAR